jgi:putative peptidoglycan lipid II flippase
MTASPRRIEISQNLSLGRASLLMALMVLLSRITGFGRMIVTANLYGRNALTDAYNAAFNIPDTISILIAGGALATGFVPVFTELVSRGDQDAARRTFRAMFTVLAASFGVITLVLFALTFTGVGRTFAQNQVQPQYVDLYFHLLRILLAAQFFFVVGGLFTGTLNALRLFWYAAVQPVVFNLGIIVFGIAGPKLWGAGIESQAWGALFGALVGSIFIQIPAVRRSGLSLAPLWDVRDAGVQRVLKSLAPIVFGLASGQVIALNLPRFLAGDGNGSITAIDNANRIMQLPLAILASGPAIALFPTLALLATQNDLPKMREELTSALRRTLALTILASALLIALRVPLVRLMLEHGRFTAADTAATAKVLACYGVGLVALAAQQILARGFYAVGRTREPVLLGIGAMLLFALCGRVSNVLDGGAAGLALAASLAICALSAGLVVSLKKVLGGWDGGRSLATLAKSFFAGSAAYGAAHLVVVLMDAHAANGHSLTKILVNSVLLGVAAILGACAFVGVGAALRLDAANAVSAKLLAKFKRGQKNL